MLLLFSFSLNTETNEATFAGNIDTQQAVQVLQQLAMADMLQKAKAQTREEIMLELEAQKDKTDE